MHAGPIGPQRVGERGHGRKRLVLHVEGLERVLGLGGRLGDDEGHRLPGVRDDLLRKDLGTGRRDQARVRHEQGQPPERGDVGGDLDVDHTGPAPGFGGVDADDARVRVRAPVHRDVERSRQRDVGDVASPPHDQARVLAPAHARTEQPLAHRLPPGTAPVPSARRPKPTPGAGRPQTGPVRVS